MGDPKSSTGNGHPDPPPGYTEASSSAASASNGISPVFQTTFACISLNMSDRIRLIRFPPDHVSQIENAIRTTWRQGIQSTRKYGGAHEIKLHGNPWTDSDWERSKMAARALISALLGSLATMGWVLKSSVDLSKKQRDKDSLLFRYQQPPPPPCDWLSISFLESDKLYVVGASTALHDAVLVDLNRMVQRHKVVKGSLQIKLHGHPWMPTSEEAVMTRVIALMLLETLEKFGFSLYAAIDQDDGKEGRDTDTWYCCKVNGWQPGHPVYHS